MRQLLEMTLKACLIIREIDGSDLVIKFAINHNYMLSVDEQIVWYLVNQTQPGMPMENNLYLIRLLIKREIVYHIRVND